jgi:biotin operon repressor
LTSLAARTAQEEGDELAQARLRGLEVWQKLRAASGGFLSGTDVAVMLELTPAAVHKRYKAHQLLGIREEKRRISYPALQFSDGRVVEHLPEILELLATRHVDDRAQLRFLAGSHGRLAGRTPVRALGDGDVSQVLAAARAFGEHGAA